MKLIQYSIEKPIPVVAFVIFIAILGVWGMYHMPLQLSPNVEEPVISVSTTWLGATPYEIERDIIEEQEKALRGIEDLVEMESSSGNGIGEIQLRFKIGTDIDNAMNRVAIKLNEVESYPENVDKPVVKRAGEDQAPKLWMVLSARDNNPRDINTYLTYFKDDLMHYLMRVSGVADVVYFGGGESQMQIIIDEQKMSARGITIPQLIEVLQQENINISAGIQDIGSKDYRLRTVAQYNSPEEIKNIIISSIDDKTVKVGDIAVVAPGIERLTTYFRFDKMVDLKPEDTAQAAKDPRYRRVLQSDGSVRWHKSIDGIDIGIKATPNANIIELTDRLEQVCAELNETILKKQMLYLEIVYDERDYPLDALALVRQNILIGALLAVIVLLLFIRSIGSTVIISFIIPISIVGSFAFMYFSGRTLNVVSLAGISFSIGMLIDQAIIILENINRHRSYGKPLKVAAYDGTSEVWKAMLASTLTNVAVFFPVIFIKEDAGQLFKDISIAICAANILSMIFSIVIIPFLYTWVMSLKAPKDWFRLPKSISKSNNSKIESIKLRLNVITQKLKIIIDRIYIFAENANEWIIVALMWTLKSVRNRLIVIISLIAFAVISTWLLMPKMEYLPQGNQNFLINVMIPPAGASYSERKAIADHFFDGIEPHFGVKKDGLPGVNYAFYVGGESLIFCGATADDKERCGELVPAFTNVVTSYPGVFGISMQTGIFQNRLGRARAITMNISGAEQEKILAAATETMFAQIPAELPNSQVRPVPSIDMSYPEVRFIPNRERLRALGLSAEDLGKIIDVSLEGREIGDYKQEGNKKIDLVLMSAKTKLNTPEKIYNSEVALLGGRSVPLSSLCSMERTFGMTQIRRLESKRTITLEITPPLEMPLEQALETLNAKIIPSLKEKDLLEEIEISTTGTSGKLTQTRDALQWNILLAIIICYFLMAIIFNSLVYPFVILLTIPFAASGGFILLKLVNLFVGAAPFDIMTMLGFVMLVGIVVNNPILIVHQALVNIREYGMGHYEAVVSSTRTRILPIYMSTFTTIFGMLPLVLAPGAGSELYRGLGAAVLGGLFMSTFITLIIVPALLMFVITKEKPAETNPL